MEKFITDRGRIEFLISKAERKTKPSQKSNAIALLTEAVQLIESLPEAEVKTNYWMAMASAYRSLDLKDQAIDMLERASEANQLCTLDSWKASNFSAIGCQYIELGESETGLEFVQTAVEIALHLPEIEDRNGVLCDIASDYGYIGQIDRALAIARLVDDRDRVIAYVLEPLDIQPSEFFDSSTT